MDGRPVKRLQLDSTSWVDVIPGLLAHADQVHDDLARTVAWQQGRVFRYERWIDEPRLGGWQAGPRRHPALQDVQAWISQRYRVRFDGVALARYRGPRDSVAWHRDREMRWLEDTVIGVLTLGARRPFQLRPRGAGRAGAGRADDDQADDVVTLHPGSGDLLVMGGRCQTAWLHAVPKLDVLCADRISAQWRWTSRRGRPDTNPSYYAPRYFSSHQ